MSLTQYTYQLDGSIVAITDEGGSHSVTVCAESVLAELQLALGSLQGKFVVWQDLTGIWDGMYYRANDLCFYPLSARTYQEAKAKLLALPAHESAQYRISLVTDQ